MIPTLETTRLRLLAPNLGCFELYQCFYSDEGASKMYGGPIDDEQIWARLKADVGSWGLLGFGVWVIQQKSDNALLGSCGFWQGYGWPRELTWWLLPKARGSGIAMEASQAAITHAYNEFGWPTVETYMNDDNLAAQALVGRLGGIEQQRQKFPDGIQRMLYRLPDPTVND